MFARVFHRTYMGPFILFDEQINNIADIVPAFELALKANRALVIIAEDVEGEALTTLVRSVDVEVHGDGDRDFLGMEW